MRRATAAMSSVTVRKRLLSPRMLRQHPLPNFLLERKRRKRARRPGYRIFQEFLASVADPLFKIPFPQFAVRVEPNHHKTNIVPVTLSNSKSLITKFSRH